MGLFQNLGNFWNNITGVTASNNAAAAQQQGIADAQGYLNPYSTAGQNAVGAQGDLLGINGAEAQAAAMQGLQNSPMFTSMVDQGERAMLQNAAATGGVRGGNTQGALAQFRPQMLSGLIQQQMQNLGGLAGQGLAATQQQAALAQNSGNIDASNILGNYNNQRGFIKDAAGFGMNIASMAMGMPPGMFGGGGGAPSKQGLKTVGGGQPNPFASIFAGPDVMGLGTGTPIMPPAGSQNTPVDLPPWNRRGPSPMFF